MILQYQLYIHYTFGTEKMWLMTVVRYSNILLSGTVSTTKQLKLLMDEYKSWLYDL